MRNCVDCKNKCIKFVGYNETPPEGFEILDVDPGSNTPYMYGKCFAGHKETFEDFCKQYVDVPMGEYVDVVKVCYEPAPELSVSMANTMPFGC